MTTTVLETLLSAKFSFAMVGKMGVEVHQVFMFAMEQLKNSIAALESGKGLYDALSDTCDEDDEGGLK